MLRRALVAMVLVCLGAGLSAAIGAAPAWACSCAPTSSPAQVRSADVIFSGRATGRDDPNEGGSVVGSGDPITWTFRVQRVHKGRAAAYQDVTSARSDASCGYVFRRGASYLVMADGQQGPELMVDACSGTRETRVPAPEAETLGQGRKPDPGSRDAAGRQQVENSSATGWVTGFVLVGLAAAGFGVWHRRRRRAG